MGKHMLKYAIQSKQDLGEILALFSDGGIVIESEVFVHIFYLFVC